MKTSLLLIPMICILMSCSRGKQQEYVNVSIDYLFFEAELVKSRSQAVLAETFGLSENQTGLLI